MELTKVGDLWVANKVSAANFVIQTPKQQDIDLLKTITELQCQLALLQKRLDDLEKLTAKN
jgi:hypothetical protein